MLLPDSIPLKVLRGANIYGPRQDPHGESGVVAIFLRRMLDGGSVRIFGDGEHTRDYVYVGDFVEAHRMAMDHAGSVVVNIGTGEGTSVNDIFRHLQSVTGNAAPPMYDAPRPGDVRHIALDPPVRSGCSAGRRRSASSKGSYEDGRVHADRRPVSGVWALQS